MDRRAARRRLRFCKHCGSLEHFSTQCMLRPMRREREAHPIVIEFCVMVIVLGLLVCAAVVTNWLWRR